MTTARDTLIGLSYLGRGGRFVAKLSFNPLLNCPHGGKTMSRGKLSNKPGNVGDVSMCTLTTVAARRIARP